MPACRLYSSAHFNDTFPPHTPPEILNTSLEGLVLLMKAMHVDKVGNHQFVSPASACIRAHVSLTCACDFISLAAYWLVAILYMSASCHQVLDEQSSASWPVSFEHQVCLQLVSCSCRVRLVFCIPLCLTCEHDTCPLPPSSSFLITSLILPNPPGRGRAIHILSSLRQMLGLSFLMFLYQPS